MNLSDELDRLQTVFIDTAPIIYYIEAHPQFGPLAKEIVDSFRSGKLIALSSPRGPMDRSVSVALLSPPPTFNLSPLTFLL